jgi:serine/threonine protein kinase
VSESTVPDAERLLLAGAPALGLEIQRALAGVETRLFGRPSAAPKLARYRLLARIGSGGAGVVYRAYDPDLDRDVAIKLLLAEGIDRGRASALREEARVLARLAHPNVVVVHDVGTYDEREFDDIPGARLDVPARGVFVVMELVEGADLRTWCARTRPSPTAIVEVLCGAGRALAAAHTAGLVHRDFKPENVIVGGDGRARVLDFGLARLVGEPGGPAGTRTYMAPEQRGGADADARSDQFSFSLVLCEALVGRGAVEAGAHARPGGVPRRLWPPLSRALASDPALRHATMDDLLAGLAAGTHRPRAGAIGIAVALAAGASAMAMSMSWSVPREAARGEGELARARALLDSGDRDAAARAIDRIEHEADEVPVRARASILRARLARERSDRAGAREALLQAIWTAEAGNDDATALDAWLLLVWNEIEAGTTTSEIETWLGFAAAAHARAGGDARRAAALALAHDQLAERTGNAEPFAGLRPILEAGT